MSIQYNYSRTGAERKALAQEVSSILRENIVYRKAPTFIYDVGVGRQIDGDDKSRLFFHTTQN